jgi:hypothetical protein
LEGNWRIAPAWWSRAGFRKFSGKNSCIARAPAARPRGFEGTTTGSDHDRTFPPLVLSHAIDEVRILIFDDPAEL